MSNNISQLLRSNRFMPFFWTQFFGAFNDNVLRQAMILLIAVSVADDSIDLMNNLALALFILPFFVFSALAGQLADKFNKTTLIRIIKTIEVVIMLVAAVGFAYQLTYLLLAVLFFMGLQSTFFGPLKYSIIPQHLTSNELVAGNALVELGTFLAILLGSVAGVLLKMGDASPALINSALLGIALLGLAAAWRIPTAPAAAPNLRINWNLINETWRIVGFAKQDRSVWLCVLGISWFWFLGAAYTTQLKRFVDINLIGTDGLYALLLASFSIGIGLGSLACEKLSKGKIRLAGVPIAALLLSLFGIDLFLAHLPATTTPVSSAIFLHLWAGWRILFDLLAIGFFGGMYIVPLFSYIQRQGNPQHLSRIIAANNVLNSLFMVASAGTAIALLGAVNLSVPSFFLVLALANILVALLLMQNASFKRQRH